jgi:hypothetical protein
MVNSDLLLCHSPGKRLLFVLYLLIGASLIYNLYCLYELHYSSKAKAMEFSMDLIGLIIVVLTILSVIFGVIWIYKLHKDLKAIFPNYEISPKKAMFMTLIPIYNLWGLWAIAEEIYDRFRINNIKLKWLKINIQSIYIFVVAIGAIDGRLNDISSKDNFANYSIQFKSIILSITVITGFIVPVLWYKIFTLVMVGINKIIENKKAGLNQY